MRSVICCISVLVMSTAFVGCGQSGTLHMPNDPNYDKRAKYLLYKDEASKPSAQKEDTAPVKQEFAAPSVETNQP
ncbi:hypothetical protein [Acinetobacter johnsonii]|uniref:hypothetical protein n=1 Tax=Acinetobacter johnsonii TaxID=40214 RepID=UPI000FBA26CC